MMKKMKGLMLIEIVGFLLIITLVCMVALAFDKHICHEKTVDMGMDSKWSLFGGCKVETKPSIWIPLERFRAFDD